MVKEVMVKRFETSDKSLFVDESFAKEYEELLIVFKSVKYRDSVCKECNSHICKIELNKFNYFEVTGCHKSDETHIGWFINNYKNFKYLFETELKDLK